MKKLVYLILLGIIVKSCSLQSTKIVYDIEKVDSTSCLYKYHKYRFEEGAIREWEGEKIDSCNKYSIGDTIK